MIEAIKRILDRAHTAGIRLRPTPVGPARNHNATLERRSIADQMRFA